jgi:glutathione S-transferase
MVRRLFSILPGLPVGGKMDEITLVIGNKNYSSWSLRGWLMLKATGAKFREIVVPLDQPETRQRILEYSPSAKVPVLLHQGLTIWDSLAIGEYLAEIFPDAALWPHDKAARAKARSVSAEMHSSFMELRREAPMNIRGRFPQRELNVQALADIRRIVEMWRECRRQFGERSSLDQGYLFGAFTIADAMFTPVATRLRTYEVGLDNDTASYVDRVLSSPAMKEWTAAALKEPWRNPKYEFDGAA